MKEDYEGNEELAVFSISFEVKGMRVPDLPAGAGNRRLGYDMLFPSDNAEAANELFYEHLGIILGDDEIKEFKAMAQKIEQQRK